MDKDHEKYLYFKGGERPRQEGDEYWKIDEWMLTDMTIHESNIISINYRRLKEPQEPEKWPPKRGKRIMVCNEDEEWEERVFLFKSVKEFACLTDAKEEARYLNSKTFECTFWKHAKPLPKPELSDAEKLDLIRGFIESAHDEGTTSSHVKSLSLIDALLEDKAQ